MSPRSLDSPRRAPSHAGTVNSLESRHAAAYGDHSRSTWIAGIEVDAVVGGCEADAARRAKEPALTSNGRDGRSSPELQREGHFCPSLQPPDYPVICFVYVLISVQKGPADTYRPGDRSV